MSTAAAPAPAPVIAPSVQRAAEDVAQAASGTNSTLLQISGPQGSGRSTALALARDIVAADGRKTLSLTPPPRPDAGAVAMLDAVEQLRRQDIVPDADVNRWQHGRLPWSERLELLGDWIAGADDLSVFCDDPGLWGAASSAASWRDIGDAVATTIINRAARSAVVAGQPPSGMRAAARFAPQLTVEDSAALLAPETWGSLGEYAAHVAAQAGEHSTALHVRVAVALQWQGVPAPLDATTGDALDALASGAWQDGLRGRRLLNAWRRLALVREPVPLDVLAEVGGLERLDEQTLAVILSCLCVSGPEGVRLHDVAVRAAEDSPVEQLRPLRRERAVIERRLFGFHRDQFNALVSASDPAAVQAAHHSYLYAASLEQPSEAFQVRAYFAEQLVALGDRLLNLYDGREADAAEVFADAIGFDDRDDAAHHGLGAALDAQNTERARAEAAHRRAVELARTRPRWHRALVEHLLGRGHAAAAERAVHAARDALGVWQDDSAAVLAFHLPVAQSLLRAGELATAREVLRGARLDDDIPDIARIRRLTEALIEAVDLGQFVPLDSLGRSWWLDGPTRLGRRRGDLHLTTWLPGRITDIDQPHDEPLTTDAAPREPSVAFEVARVDLPPVGDRPPARRTRLAIGTAVELCEDADGPDAFEVGALIEFGVYGDGAETILRLVADRPLDLEDLGAR